MKVFISSTFEDLKEYRQAVRSAVLRLGHHPIGMEDFGSRPSAWDQAALDAVNACHVFVGIYARRYGSIPQGDDLSITEQEFDRAHALGIPRFCYHLDSKYTWPEKYIDAGVDEAKLDRFLGKVDRLLRSTFTTPDDLARQVGTDLGREFSGRHFSDSQRSESTAARTAPPSGGMTISDATISTQGDLTGRDKVTNIHIHPAIGIPALHSLPAPPSDFQNRKNEVQQVLSSLGNAPSIAISGIMGMGGVGKTALALFIAQLITDRYPDAQIFIELMGKATASNPAWVMRQIIFAFEPRVELARATDEQIRALYRSILSGKRALLVFDNVADVSQLKDLLPPVGCAVIVTSRSYFTLPGLKAIRLSVLSEIDACKILLELCPRAGGHAKEIANLCGFLPLALRIAGSTLTEHPDITPSEYVEMLRDRARVTVLKSETNPDLDVRATFDLSYSLIHENMQTKWRKLAVFSAPFDVKAVAALWNVDRATSHVILSELHRCSLIEYDASTRRYFLHDLLALYAGERLGSEEKNEAHIRHAEYYLTVAETADKLYLGGGEELDAGLSLFDQEWENIKSAQAWAALAVKEQSTAAHICDAFAAASVFCLARRLRPLDRIAWLEAGVDGAAMQGEELHLSVHLGNLADAYLTLGSTQSAIELAERALEISRRKGNRSAEGKQVGTLGSAYSILGNFLRAIGYFNEALSIAQETHDRRAECTQLANLGNAYLMMGQYRRAEDYCGRALTLAENLKENHIRANCLTNLGNIHFAKSEYSIALVRYQQALDIAHVIQDRREEAAYLTNVAGAYAATGDLHRAIKFYDDALALCRAYSDREGEATVLANLGLVYADLYQTSKAIEYYQEALAVASERPDHRTQGVCYGYLGMAYSDMGELGKAIEYYQRALRIAKALSDKQNEGNWLFRLGDASERIKHTEEAISFYRDALTIFDSIGSSARHIARNRLRTLGVTVPDLVRE